jgi:hypothetical protein
MTKSSLAISEIAAALSHLNFRRPDHSIYESNLSSHFAQSRLTPDCFRQPPLVITQVTGPPTAKKFNRPSRYLTLSMMFKVDEIRPNWVSRLPRVPAVVPE